MSATGLRKEDFNLEFLLDIVVAEVCKTQSALRPRYNVPAGSLYLRLVKRGPLVGAPRLVYDEKVGTARTLHLRVGIERQHLAVGVVFDVLGNDADVRFVASLSLHEALEQSLIAARHHLVEGKLQRAQVIVLVRVVDLRVVVDVVHVDLELVIELKVILAGNLGDELGIQVVMDHLRLADLEPLVAILLVHEEDRVGLGECVLVLQGFALESELELLNRLVGVHRVLGELENGFVKVAALA